uniref:E3 ubiquitin-protein ligase n=1 Tax=Heterorhabditis bacteriophora TaxID=37862 RepID=A0A1I7WSW7_HETBA
MIDANGPSLEVEELLDELNWKQLSQLMGGGIESRTREARAVNRQTLRNWDDELVLKCTFQALIPAFDPRPGRTNVNQTQDVELPAVVHDSAQTKSVATEEASLRLFVRGPNMNGIENVTVEMDNDENSIFFSGGKLPYCVLSLMKLAFIYLLFVAVNMYMQATAFGVSRTIVWLQSRRDAALDRVRGAAQSSASSATRPHDRYQEYRVGRLKHERIKVVTRSEEHLLEQAIRVMKFHADRKAVLEIEYNGEEGTGLGPTLEFYALVSVAAELQRKVLAIWLCDDMDEHQLKMEERELDLGEGKKPPGFYVRRAGGLFPAPLPPHTDEVRRASEMFRILGIFLAKVCINVLQDGRLVDLPLARPFLKLLVSQHLSEADEPTLDRVLSLDDFEEVHPVKGGFLKELRALAQRKRAIENEPMLDRDAKRRKIDELKLCIHGTRCRVEDLALNFTFLIFHCNLRCGLACFII